MQHITNPQVGTGLATALQPDVPYPSVDAARPMALLNRCRIHTETPLILAGSLASETGVASLFVKDERGRMGLGSFKALGAAYVIADQAVATGVDDLSTALSGRTFVTASAGNHGLSVAAGARVFGASSVVYLSATVPEKFADRLRSKGSQVLRHGADYEASMAGAMQAANDKGWTLLSDSSWDGYYDLPHKLMEGYLVMAAEALNQMPAAPTHIFLQAGVGGLAGAVAAYARFKLGNDPRIIVVEPKAAPCLIESVKAGRFVTTKGPVSNMGRLDCKEASLIALKGLSRDASDFCTLSEEEAANAMPSLSAHGFATSPSGGAGLVALMQAKGAFGLNASSQVLCFLSEGPT